MSDHLTIKQAAKVCGLSPSVLRVWEFRYGWPCPRRSPNGYRAFTKPQVEELKRASSLVKSGMPVSQLIIDGFPRWPAQETDKPRIRRFEFLRQLPHPGSQVAEQLRERLAQALEQANGGRVLELLQGACIEVRPAEEVLAVLLPTIIGLAELENDHRALREADSIRQMLADRGRQLLRRLPSTGQVRIVVPVSEADRPLAAVVAALLARTGQAVDLRDVGHAAEGAVLVGAKALGGQAGLRVAMKAGDNVQSLLALANSLVARPQAA